MDLKFPSAKEALTTRTLDDINPVVLAELLYEYFAAPAESSHEMLTGHSNPVTGEPIKTTVHVKRPLPLVSEFARICRLTQRELKLLAKLHPIVARALEFAQDIQEEYLLRRSLEGEWGVQATHFVSMNLTKLRDKPPVADGDPSELSNILNAIEEEGQSLLPSNAGGKPAIAPPTKTSEKTPKIKTLV